MAASSAVLLSVVSPPDHVVLQVAVSAYLGRYRGGTGFHIESDLRIFLTWYTEQNGAHWSAVRAD